MKLEVFKRNVFQVKRQSECQRLSGNYDSVSEVAKEENDNEEIDFEDLKRHSGQFDVGCYSLANDELDLINNMSEVVDANVSLPDQLPSFSLQFGSDEIHPCSLSQVPDQHQTILSSNMNTEYFDLSYTPSQLYKADYKAPGGPFIDLPSEDLSGLSCIGDDFGLSEFLSPLEQSIDFNFLSEFQS